MKYNFRTIEEYEDYKAFKRMMNYIILVFVSTFVIISLFFCAKLVHADTDFNNEAYYNQLADAIFWAEGGYNTKYPYGIKSVKCDGYKDCRQVCLNTIKNNVKRYEKAVSEGYKLTYLEFLQTRYAPHNAENDPTGLNNNWLKNVTYFLNNPKPVKK